jgi:hypothetical protein
MIAPLNRRDFLKNAALLAAGATLFAGAPLADETDTPAIDCDTFVYGSTPGGIAAALEAARRGCSVVLACPQNNAGGMAASGLCTTDAVRRRLFGGFVSEFTGRVRAHYAKTIGENSPEWGQIKDGWFYAPSVAEMVFDTLLSEQKELRFLRAHHLFLATVANARIVMCELVTGDGARIRVRARTYIDGTYEGDLAAAAKVPYRVGRESKDEFGESLAGIHYMNWKTGKQIATPDTGEASPAIQSFCARCIFTDDEEQRVPIEKPASYEQHLPDFLPLLEDFAAGRVKRWAGGTTLPGRRFEFNGNIEWMTSFNCPGVSWNWPEAQREHRARLAQFHIDHAAGMMWFVQNDTRVPDTIRNQVKNWGLHKGEFAGNAHWPWQIYVRQGRRIEGRAKITQHNFIVDPKSGRTPVVEHPVAVGEHSFDVHPCHDRRYAVEGFMEGVLWYPHKADGPAQPGQIPWGALLPKTIDNLLVPVALSSTHIAMSVLRMEPVWMTTGQLAGLASAVAKDKSCDVAALDPDPLPQTLKIVTDAYQK